MVYIVPINEVVTEANGYRVHRYVTTGTFDITVTSPGKVDILVVGGGGAGGGGVNFNPGGGGGGGNVIYYRDYYIPAGIIKACVGAGGTGVAGSAAPNGTNSYFGSVIAFGGGGGGQGNIVGIQAGVNGGSGGGGSRGNLGGTATKWIGNGNNGGSSGGNLGSTAGGGGGGGASAAGGNSGGNFAGPGGEGLSVDITGTSVVYGSGGGGGRRDNGAGAGGTNAGNGGGTNSVGGNAVANCGGGGGGAGSSSSTSYKGGNGGSGIIVIRYPISNFIGMSNITISSFSNVFGSYQTSISMSDYYKNSAYGFSANVPLIPLSGNSMSVSQFRGKTSAYPSQDVATSPGNCLCIYSLRRISGKYSGPTVRVRRSTDNTEANFYANMNGALGTAINATGTSLKVWVGTGNAYVTTWYDQTGFSNNLTMATAASQPLLTTHKNAYEIYFGGSNFLEVISTSNDVQNISMITSFTPMATSNTALNVMGKMSSSANRDWGVWLSANVDSIYFERSSNNVAYTATSSGYVQSNILRNRVAYTATSVSSVMSTYINGKSNATATTLGETFATTGALRLGGTGVANARFVGYIHDLTLYNVGASNVDLFNGQFFTLNSLTQMGQDLCQIALSTRLVSSLYDGPIVRIRRDTDCNIVDFFGNPSGDLAASNNATSTTLSNWLGVATGYVETWYDQSGCGNNAMNSNVDTQPTITYNSTTGLYEIAASNDILYTPYNYTTGQARSLYITHNPKSGISNSEIIGFTSNETLDFGMITSSNRLRIVKSTSNFDISGFTYDSNYNSFALHFNGTSTYVNLPSSEQQVTYTNSNHFNWGGCNLTLFSTDNSNNRFFGNVKDLFWFSSNLTVYDNYIMRNLQDNTGVFFGQRYSSNLRLALAFVRVNPYYTGPCVRVQRSGDNTQRDIGFDETMSLDVVALSNFAVSNTTNIVAWYDQSGNNFHMTMSNSIPITSNVLTSGLNFTGASSQFGICDGLVSGSVVGSATNFGINSSNPRTILVGVQQNAAVSGGSIFDIGGSLSNSDFALRYVSSTTNTVTYRTMLWGNDYDATFSNNLGVWTTAAVTHCNGLTTTYFDGTQVGFKLSNISTQNLTNFQIGRWYTGSFNNMNAKSVFMFTRSAPGNELLAIHTAMQRWNMV